MSTCWVCAISFRISWITTRSYIPTSLSRWDSWASQISQNAIRLTYLGVISIWKLLWTMFTSNFRLDGVMNTLWSILSYENDIQQRTARIQVHEAYLFYTFSKQLPQHTSYACLLSCSRWAIEEHVWKVAWGSLNEKRIQIGNSFEFSLTDNALVNVVDWIDFHGSVDHRGFSGGTTVDIRIRIKLCGGTYLVHPKGHIIGKVLCRIGIQGKVCISHTIVD